MALSLLKKKNIDSTEGPIFSKMISFVIPLMLTNLMQQLYSIADNIVVGQYSGDPNALGAVGSVSSFNALLTQIFIGFAAGTSVVVARSFGARDRDTLSKAAHTALIFAILSGVITGIVGILISSPVLTALDTKAELFKSALLYMRVLCIGMPAVSVYNYGAAVLRSVGDSQTPLYTLTLSGVLNVLLNLVFVIVFRLSVVGVAIATVVSQYVSAIIVLTVLTKRREEPYALSRASMRIDRALLLRILYLGVPAAVQGSLFGVTNLLLQKALNAFPTPVISARAIATNIDVLLSTAINTYLHVAMTFTGQNLGARKYSRIKKSLLYAILQVTVIGVVVGQIMIYFYEPLVGLYLAGDNPYRTEILAACKTIMTVMLSTYFIGAIVEALSGFIRGLGSSIAPMLVSIFGICIFRSVWILWIFPVVNEIIGLAGLYLVYPTSWAVTAIGLATVGLIVWRKKVVPDMRENRMTADVSACK